MNFTASQFEPMYYWIGWIAWVPLAVWCMKKAPWKSLAIENRIHFWLGSIVVLILLWSIKAGIQPGLDLHLLGVNLLVLAFGPELAFLAASLVLFGVALNAGMAWFSLGLNSLVMVGLAIVISSSLSRLIQTKLPRQVFIFIFCNGFFVSGLTLVLIGCCSTLLLSMTGQYSLAYLLDEYLPYYFLLAFSESWLSGMVVTLLVIYRPEWLAMFDQQRYFKHSDQSPFH
jgi:uncharacterized membrane protein